MRQSKICKGIIVLLATILLFLEFKTYNKIKKKINAQRITNCLIKIDQNLTLRYL